MKLKANSFKIILFMMLLEVYALKLLFSTYKPKISQSPRVINIHDFLPGVGRFTFLAWIGAGAGPLCAFSIRNPEDSLDFTVDTDTSSNPILIMNSPFFYIPVGNNTVGGKNWFRFMVSVNTTTGSVCSMIDDATNTLTSSFTDMSTMYISIGDCNPANTIASEDIAFGSTYLFPTYYDSLDFNFIQNELFRFPPQLKLLTHLHKHGPYTKIYTNHVKGQKDIKNGLNYTMDFPMNVANSFENIGTPLLMPNLDFDNFDYDQSHMVVLKFSLILDTIMSTNINYDLFSTLFQRTTSSNVEIYRNYLQIKVKSSLDLEIKFEAVADSSNHNIDTHNFGNINTLGFEVYFEYFVISIKKTVFDNKAKITIMNPFIPVHSSDYDLTFNVDDKIYIGDTLLRDAKFSGDVPQFHFLKIYEIAIFEHVLITEDIPTNTLWTGITHDQFPIKCDFVELTKRFSLAYPFELIYDTCISETFYFSCADPFCMVCEGGTCYVCSPGFELNKTTDTCIDCKTMGKVWEPLLRQCITIGKSNIDYVFPNDDWTWNTPFSTSGYVHHTAGDSANPDALNLKIFSYKFEMDIFPVNVFVKIKNFLTLPYQYMQFLDVDLLDHSVANVISFYLSFSSIGNYKQNRFVTPYNYTGNMILSYADVYLENLNNWDKNIVCHKANVLYINFNTVECLDTCPTNYYSKNGKCVLCTPLDFNCEYIPPVCSNGEIDILGICTPCAASCKECETSVDNCTECFTGYNFILSSPNNYCEYIIITPPPLPPGSEDNNIEEQMEEVTEEIIENIVEIEEPTVINDNCDEGFYYDGLSNECKNCQYYCISCVSYSNCLACEDNFDLVSDRCLTQTKKIKGIPFDDISEETFIPNCELSVNSVCVLCIKGYYLDAKSNCKPCSYSCIECISHDTCSACKNGFFHVNNDCIGDCIQGILYLKDNVCLNCEECNNCVECGSCLKCAYQMQYTMNKKVNGVKFIFDKEVILTTDFDLTPSTKKFNLSTRDKSSLYIDNDTFTLNLSRCNLDITEETLSLEVKENELDFNFNLPYKNYDCLLTIKLKDNLVIFSPMSSVQFKRIHSIIL